MSSNGVNPSDMAGRPSAAVDVGFSSIAKDRYGESSSQVESGSSEKRSIRSRRSNKSAKQSEELATPQNGTSTRNEEHSSTGSLGHRARKSGGFLLDSVFTNGSPKRPDSSGKRKAPDGYLQVDKRRAAHSPFSGDSSQRSSPLSRQASMGVRDTDGTDEQPRSRPPSQTIDPTQLVQMALNLSESRKRHVSNTLQVPLPPVTGRRATSGPVSAFGTVRASSSGRKRISQLSEDIARGTPSSDRSGVDGMAQPDESASAVEAATDNVFYTFSPATLSRAEKARKYFELASEHRRLLQSLPPLKPDSAAPGNYTFETTSSPGSAYPQITRTFSSTDNKHALGRQYNPIQSLRNRRVRIREKRPFTTPPDSWAETEKVKNWMEDLEAGTRDPYYRASDDRVQLPPFTNNDSPGNGRNNEPTTRHRRTDTVGSVITRPEYSWTIEPTELLADAYWTENGNNKAYVENRHGNTIFPRPERKSIDTPKISIEMHRGKDDDGENANNTDGMEVSGKPSRTRRLMMPLKGYERRKHRPLISRSSSANSSSSDERPSRNLSRDRRIGEENIGPLERHMQDLIAKDEQGELSSPEVTATDHWDPKNLPYLRTSRDKPHRESVTRPNGRASLEVPRIDHRRSKSADGRVGSVDHGRSSTEESASTPLSPVVATILPSADLDSPEPPTSRHSLDAQRSHLKLPTFRSHSKERNKIAQTDFADGGVSNLPAIQSAGLRTSQESTRPSQYTRYKTNESYSHSLHHVETSSSTGTFGSMRESGKVGRLLKGGRDRLGTLVRGDGPRFSDRFKNRDRLDAGGMSDISRVASDVEDTETDGYVNGHLKRRITDSAADDSDVSPRTSLERVRTKPKYHMSNLPSFTSSARDKRLQFDFTQPTGSDPISRQQRAQREVGRSERFDRLAPPRIDLPNNLSNPELAVDPGDALTKNGKSYAQLNSRLNSMALGAPIVALGGLARSPGQRHWSIYDQVHPQQADKITSRDIARVRALLLCSGIKAREIQRRADDPHETPASVYAKAAETAGQGFDLVPLKEIPLVSARMLNDHLTSSFSGFERTLSGFQNETAKRLASQLDELQHRTTDHLTKLVHDTSDEADAFTVELTTRQPQQVKQVDDAVDAMLRRRRRQFRLLRRAGFKLLEWFVLGLMWWIWFLVVMFNTFRRVIVGLLRFLRWLVVF